MGPRTWQAGSLSSKREAQETFRYQSCDVGKLILEPMASQKTYHVRVVSSRKKTLQMKKENKESKCQQLQEWTIDELVGLKVKHQN